VDYNLLSVGIDPKTRKGEKKGFLTGILYLSPARVSGHNVCPNSTTGCRAACINTAGYGGIFNTIQIARKRKTEMFYKEKDKFFFLLQKDIDKLRRVSEKRNLIPCVRLNGTSDLAHEKIAPYLFENNRDIKFYDYTKSERRYQDFLDNRLPKNYHLTLSSHENMALETIDEYITHGGKVTVVFSTPKSKELPKKWKGHKVYDGDTSDLRFLDPKGFIIGLKAKGKARKDTTGFVVQV
jgi:hypothetical protein